MFRRREVRLASAKRKKKIFAQLNGKPVWLHTIGLFSNREDVAQSLVVIAPDDEDLFRDRYGHHLALLGIELVLGGNERFESVANALAKIKPEVDFVAIHDAVRPCVTHDQNVRFIPSKTNSNDRSVSKFPTGPRTVA